MGTGGQVTGSGTGGQVTGCGVREPLTSRSRLFWMERSRWTGWIVSILILLSGCAAAEEGDCVSSFEVLASAPSWAALEQRLLKYDALGEVTSVRRQAEGQRFERGGKTVVRVVDLLDQKRHRLAQVDVWREADGEWQAGIWGQCTD